MCSSGIFSAPIPSLRLFPPAVRIHYCVLGFLGSTYNTSNSGRNGWHAYTGGKPAGNVRGQQAVGWTFHTKYQLVRAGIGIDCVWICPVPSLFLSAGLILLERNDRAPLVSFVHTHFSFAFPGFKRLGWYARFASYICSAFRWQLLFRNHGMLGT